MCLLEALKRKWNSCRGASILLALLFMLMCIMAGTSVLMAGASNVGKISGDKDEQQKYLTLSSALQLLVAELESVEYVGKYVYTPGTVAESKLVNTYEQTQGEFIARIDDATNLNLDGLKNILPLFDNMDYFYADMIIENYSDIRYDGQDTIGGESITRYTKYVTNADEYMSPENQNRTEALAEYKKVSLDTKYELEFTVNNGSNYGFTDTVRITVSTNREGNIYLNAEFVGSENLKMRAIMKSDITSSVVSSDIFVLHATWQLEEIKKIR